jgi:hypothetical protein
LFPSLLVAALVIGCGGRSRATDEEELATSLAVGVALAPQQDLLVWTTDEEGREASVWLRGNVHEAAVVASGAGLVIPVGAELWQWRETEVAVPLCDCEEWERSGSEGVCPETLEPGWARSVELVELISGDTVTLVGEPDTGQEDDDLWLMDYSSVTEPIASVGPYLFYRIALGFTECGPAHGTWFNEFVVFNLATREQVDVMTPEERARILAEEQQTAYELMRDDRLVEIDGPEDLELTVVQPQWQPGGLGVLYQFTAEASYADSDDNWGAYTRSVQVPARVLPAALIPFALLPDVLDTATLPAGGDLRVGGFGPIAGTDEQVAAVFDALGVVPESAPESPPKSQ